MASKPIALPPNWQLSAVNWAAKQAGMSYGAFLGEYIRNNPNRLHEIEEEFKANYIAQKRAEAARIAAHKKDADARARRAAEKKKAKSEPVIA